MREFAVEAEALFRRFAERHSLTIEKVGGAPFELSMRLPPQERLSFELTLGLQNVDELNIGVEDFWSHFFPFERSLEVVDAILDDLVAGGCRIATHRHVGVVVRRVLERRENGRWRPVCNHPSCLRLPLVKTRISYLYNEAQSPPVG
jgi:hypothetical protein